MQKYHFRPYSPNQTVLFPERIDKDISPDDPVRLVSAVIDNLDISGIRRLYKACGRSPYHPKMLLKVVLYAYMNNIYSCRKIESSLKRDVHFIWLAGYEQPDFVTVNRFRNRVKDEINKVFTQLVLLLNAKGLVTLDVEYIDGTKIESKANKYTFVWRKTVERNRARLMEKIKVLLSQIDEAIAQDKAAADEAVSFTPEVLTEICAELRDTLSKEPAPTDKEGKASVRQRQKQVRELEEMADKLSEYDEHLEKLGGRNSYSKTDTDATFMRMKEDAMNNGQTKPGYNVQISTENQYITNYGIYWRPNDQGTLIPFMTSFSDRYGVQSEKVVADAGYGSEQNYAWLEDNRIEAFVKYNMFHAEDKRKYRDDPFLVQNLHYNEEEDYYVCPMGQHMEHIGDVKSKSDLGYVSTISRYRAHNCTGCPLRCMCYKGKGDCRIIEVNHKNDEYKAKAKERLTSEEGLYHRSMRPIEPEAVFGDIKFDHGFKRFRLRGDAKVSVEFGLVALAHNLRKYAKVQTLNHPVTTEPAVALLPENEANNAA